MRTGREVAWIVAAGVMLVGQVAMAFHTQFLYRVERFEADGNVLGPLGGAPGVVDDFTAAPLSPLWYQAYGTVSEGNGYLVLSNPGAHFPAPPDPSSAIGALLDLSVAASASPTYVYDGSGDFAGTAYWEGVLPDVGHHYHFSIYTFGGMGGFYAETFGLAILRRDDDTVQMEQHLTEIDQWSGTYQNTQLLFHDIDQAQATGPFIFRIMFDDATNQATTEFSLDGGTTWESPFPPGLVFQGRTQAQFLLSADPYAGAGVGGTTTTTISSSTTTTTLPGGPCVATGCRVSTLPFKAKLVVKDKSSASADMLSFKWKKGESTAFAELGSPLTTTDYWFCLGNGAGTNIFEVAIPSGPCAGGQCWRQTGDGYLFTDASGANGGVRKLKLRWGAGVYGKSSVELKIQGENLTVPTLPLGLPITARVSNGLGECWAEEFDASGLMLNSTSQFSGKSN